MTFFKDLLMQIYCNRVCVDLMWVKTVVFLTSEEVSGTTCEMCRCTHPGLVEKGNMVVYFNRFNTLSFDFTQWHSGYSVSPAAIRWFECECWEDKVSWCTDSSVAAKHVMDNLALTHLFLCSLLSLFSLFSSIPSFVLCPCEIALRSLKHRFRLRSWWFPAGL